MHFCKVIGECSGVLSALYTYSAAKITFSKIEYRQKHAGFRRRIALKKLNKPLKSSKIVFKIDILYINNILNFELDKSNQSTDLNRFKKSQLGVF